MTHFFKFMFPLLLILAFNGCSFQSIFKKEAIFFNENVRNNPIVKQTFYKTDEVNIYHAYTDNIKDKGSEALIVFIHGTPGSWAVFGRYLINESLLAQANMIAYDRPGWGYSSYKNKKLQMGIEPDIGKQASTLAQFLKDVNIDNRPVILVGFSYGVPVAMRTALDFPKQVAGLVLVAGMLDPEVEGPRWYNRFTATKLGQWVVPDELKRSNIEMMAKQKYIEESAKKYPQLRIPLTVIQGEKDELVYPSNLDFAERTFNPETTDVISIPKQGHIVILEQHAIVFKVLNEMLQKITNGSK